MIPGVAASETGGAQTGTRACRGMGPQDGCARRAERHWEGRPEGVKAPYAEPWRMQAGAGVPRGTRNPVGRRGGHPARLNTCSDR